MDNMSAVDTRPRRRASTPQAHYDAAKITRRTANWRADSSGPNREIERDLVKLRDRARDLGRNNPWARRAIQAIVTNTVGAGIVAQWSAPERQARWRAWFETTGVDADGRADGYGLQSLILRAMVESGEVLIRRRPRRPDDGYAVPLQLQVLESDYLDHAKTEVLPNGGYIVQGVEFNVIGQRVAYWIFKNHPGDALTWSQSASSFQCPASEILHLLRADRPGQVRGVPWGTGAMTRLKMLDDFEDAELEKMRLAACFVAFVREPNQPEVPSADEYELLDRLQPGAVEILPPGKDVTFASPPQPGDADQFKRSVLRAVASDYGITFEALTNDLSEVNFSSARMGWQEFGRNIDAWRWQLLAPQLLRPLAAWFLDAERIVAPDAPPAEDPLWTAPGRTLVDPTREIPAIRDAVRAGLISLPQAIRMQGYDPEILARENAAYLALTNDLGLLLDTDPRADKGRGQPPAPETEPAAAPLPDDDEPPPRARRARTST